MAKLCRVSMMLLAVAGLILLTGCSKLADPLAGEPEPNTVHAASSMFTSDIWAGQNTDAGDLDISFTYDYIYLEYNTVDNWYLTSAEAHVATTLDDLPHSGGGLTPGQFAYKYTLNNLQHFIIAIPFDDAWRDAESLYIAAHCNLSEIVGGEVIQTQTGWCDTNPYPGRNWSTYIVVPNVKTLNLPSGTVKVQYTGVTNCGYGYSPTQFHVWNVPSGYSLTDGYYSSFCLDRGIYIYGQAYDAKLWSSYDPTMPDYIRYVRNTTIPVPYDQLNYLLNQYIAGGFTNDEIVALQQAFWYWRGNLEWTQLNTFAQSMVNDAAVNGVNFYPMPGQWMAVLLDIANNVQLCFIVVDP